MAKEKERVIPKKNYYLLALLSVFTILILYYFVNWYQTKQKYELTNSSVAEIVSEVKQNELPNYLLDNPNIVVYFTSYQDKSIKSFEKEFKKYILKYELADEIVVVDTDKIEERKFYTSFANQYFTNELKMKHVNLNYLPNMLVIKDGKVQDVLITYDADMTLSEVMHFLKKNGVVEA